MTDACAIPQSTEPLVWPMAETWMSVVADWLTPRLASGGLSRLRQVDTSELYVDDLTWMEMLESALQPDVIDVREAFANELEGKIVRSYHGCRTEDAGDYFREGIRVHRREELEERLRRIVEENDSLRWMIPTLSQRMAEFPSSTDVDRCFVVLDNRAMLKYAAHYLIYGSEWICAVLGHGYRDPLLKIGVPTMIEVDLPLSWASEGDRRELADLMLGEWLRQTLDKPDQVRIQDFTFVLHRNLPPETVVGHYHPRRLRDPLEKGIPHHSPNATCLHCS